MYKNQRIAVVVPAHNEARHVVKVISTVPSYVDYVIVVDDCSSDDTHALLSAVIDPRLVILRTQANEGVGGATMLGYRQILENNCDIAVKMDGDGQMSPDHLDQLLDSITDLGYDYA